MDEENREEQVEAPKLGETKGKEHVYMCRSCGATAPKKKGLCRPEKIREVRKRE